MPLATATRTLQQACAIQATCIVGVGGAQLHALCMGHTELAVCVHVPHTDHCTMRSGLAV